MGPRTDQHPPTLRCSKKKIWRGFPRIETWEDFTEQKKGQSHELVEEAADQHLITVRCWRQSEKRRKRQELEDMENLQEREKLELQQEQSKNEIIAEHDE